MCPTDPLTPQCRVSRTDNLVVVQSQAIETLSGVIGVLRIRFRGVIDGVTSFFYASETKLFVQKVKQRYRCFNVEFALSIADCQGN